ncbi:MAG: type II secretion system protein [Chitinispirillaceae bacterium]|nr:type II secretion system protein [Chitinispirillaceae bacterium]
MNREHQSSEFLNFAIKRNGFTVLEVIVAIFIFGCISAALVKTLSTADRIRGRASFISETTILAQNEAERLRNAASFKTEVLDCTYIATVNSRSYSVERRIIDIETGILENKNIPEIELAIKTELSDSGYIYFRFLQGFSW